MINILFIHQSADLYGSDKTLLLLLKNLNKSKFSPIVVLPVDGPLKREIEKENITVFIAPVLKLHRKMFNPFNLLKFYTDIEKAVIFLDKINYKYRFDLIYSNTLAVLLGLIYAKKRKIKHIWHVHEIIESPRIFTKIFTKFLNYKYTTRVVYNSIATQLFWDVNKNISNKSIVIWNGLEIPTEYLSYNEITLIRKDYFKSNKNDIVIALVGRINRWKGQLVLLDSFSQLIKLNSNIKLVFIGSPAKNQEIHLLNLENQINKKQLHNKVFIIPYQKVIQNFWQCIDIAIVPSTDPEPFGLVAVEAMLAKKPVIASNHGGLMEIVIHNETGLLVEPGNVKALSGALQILIENKELRNKYGINGYQRAIEVFSMKVYVEKFENLFINTL